MAVIVMLLGALTADVYDAVHGFKEMVQDSGRNVPPA